MIRVIIERRVKGPQEVARLLHQLRIVAMSYRGYITGETLVSTQDATDITVVSTWRSLEDWKAWEASEQRAAVDRLIQPLLVEPPIVKTYRMMSTQELNTQELNY